jgi:hypothetical protein
VFWDLTNGKRQRYHDGADGACRKQAERARAPRPVDRIILD